MTRFPEIKPENYTAEERAAVDKIVKSRGSMRGPFVPALHSPGVLRAIEMSGAYLRFENSLPDDLKELAILVAGRFWTAQYEWYAHSKLAYEAGLDPKIIAAIEKGEAPSGMNAEQIAIYNFCVELHGTHAVSDKTFNAVADKFGRRGVMDLIGLCGHYTFISMILNTAQIPIPEGATPLAPLKRR